MRLRRVSVNKKTWCGDGKRKKKANTSVSEFSNLIIEGHFSAKAWELPSIFNLGWPMQKWVVAKICIESKAKVRHVFRYCTGERKIGKYLKTPWRRERKRRRKDCKREAQYLYARMDLLTPAFIAQYFIFAPNVTAVGVSVSSYPPDMQDMIRLLHSACTYKLVLISWSRTHERERRLPAFESVLV